MIEIKDKTECSGCFACYNICPKNAIEMIEDKYGFKYPIVSKDKCINCGLCEKICPVKNCKKIENEPSSYACKNKNKDIRLESSSGGVFSLLAEYVLNHNGIVFGAAFDEKFELNHIFIDNYNDIKKLLTSKYVQSNVGNTYKQAKDFLDNGKLVLYTGTPCQVEGLLSFLNKDYDNLITQDIICHGVPSPKVWRNYLEYRKNIDKDKLISVNFRNKDNGWKNFNLKFTYNSKQYRKCKDDDVYMKSFLNNLCLRDSCYECSFKKENRLSDITLGDFWGIQNIDKNFDDDKGVSAVIINSKKGKKIFEAIKDKMVIKNVNISDIIRYNSAFNKSANLNNNRELFFKNLENCDFKTSLYKCVPKPTLKHKIKLLAKKLIGK